MTFIIHAMLMGSAVQRDNMAKVTFPCATPDVTAASYGDKPRYDSGVVLKQIYKSGLVLKQISKNSVHRYICDKVTALGSAT
jgi:hypothetical protein